MDKALSKAKLTNLLNNNKRFSLRAESSVFPDIIAGNVDHPDYFRFVCRYNDILTYVPSNTSTLPIGLIQVDIAYEAINVIFEYNMDAEIYNSIPPEILKRFTNTNVMEGHQYPYKFTDSNKEKKIT